MSTLIVYSTKYGCTEECASRLSKKLSGEVESVNIKKANIPDLSRYEKIIVGGSIYIGRIQKEVSEFCLSNLDTLKNKKLGLFICCMRDGEDAKTQMDAAFPKELSNNAYAREIFGGEYVFKKMKFMDRFIVKNVAKTDKDVSNILEDNIESFAQLMNNA